MRINADGTVSPSDVRQYCHLRIQKIERRTIRSVRDNHEIVILYTILKQFTKIKNMRKELDRSFRNGEGI